MNKSDTYVSPHVLHKILDVKLLYDVDFQPLHLPSYAKFQLANKGNDLAAAQLHLIRIKSAPIKVF